MNPVVYTPTSRIKSPISKILPVLQRGTTTFYSEVSEFHLKPQNYVLIPRKNSLFSGFLGSLFSFLQFVSSPVVGAFSDVYGRKILILLCLVRIKYTQQNFRKIIISNGVRLQIGIGLSYFLWSMSTSFLTFVIARVIGGISKGNLSLSMAAMTDISSSEKRGSGMVRIHFNPNFVFNSYLKCYFGFQALIGAAFSVGFVVGPLIGAFFIKPFSAADSGMIFATPAWFALYLTVTEIIFVGFFFKETLSPVTTFLWIMLSPLLNFAKENFQKFDAEFQF